MSATQSSSAARTASRPVNRTAAYVTFRRRADQLTEPQRERLTQAHARVAQNPAYEDAAVKAAECAYEYGYVVRTSTNHFGVDVEDDIVVGVDPSIASIIPLAKIAGGGALDVAYALLSGVDIKPDEFDILTSWWTQAVNTTPAPSPASRYRRRGSDLTDTRPLTPLPVAGPQGERLPSPRTPHAAAQPSVYDDPILMARQQREETIRYRATAISWICGITSVGALFGWLGMFAAGDLLWGALLLTTCVVCSTAAFFATLASKAAASRMPFRSMGGGPFRDRAAIADYRAARMVYGTGDRQR